MNIIKIIHIEDCFDGSYIKEVFLDEIISKSFIDYLSEGRTYQYFPSFLQPFYKIDIPDSYQIKGVEGQNSFRILIFNMQKYEYLIQQIKKGG